MATNTFFSSFNMDTATIWDGSVTVASSSQVRVTDGYKTQNYYGSGLIHTPHILSGGSITSSNYYQGSQKIYEITGGSYSANTIANHIINSDVNGLFSYVFAGSDRFVGSSGNDVLNSRAGSDSIFGNAGNDTLKGGTGNDFLYGGADKDMLYGDADNDVIDGGLGNDVTFGGNGRDIFLFKNAPNAATNIDTIRDFVVADDTFQFENAIFTGLGTTTGAFTPDAFIKGAGLRSALDAEDRMIYNTTDGAVYYDADGTGSANAPIRLMLIANKPALTYADFHIV